MRRFIVAILLLIGLVVMPISTFAQTDSPFVPSEARLNGLTLPQGTRYVLILPYNNTDALYDLRVTVDSPLGTQLISAQETDSVAFVGASQNETYFQIFWSASEIFSGDLFAPFAFTLAQPLTERVYVAITWRDSLDQPQTLDITLAPNTLNAVDGVASFNPEAPVPAGQFTFIGDTGVVIYAQQDLPANAITVREASPEENPPAELGDFWWCSGLELSGASNVTVYVPLRKPLPPLMPLTLFAQIDGVWQTLEAQGYVSADGLYAVYDHPGGLIFTGTDAENNPQEAPPAPPPPADSDGDGFTDDVDACPTEGNLGFGVDGAGCPLPPPDSDGDGFIDPNDVCPTQGDAGFGLGGDGCPLPPSPPPPDTDGDGISDFADACPAEGDLGLGISDDGCPILPPVDTDGDGIPDPNDVCPEQGDGGFGLSADGCPLLPTFTPTSEIPAPTDVPTVTPIPPTPAPFPPELVLFGFATPNIVFGRTAQAQIAIAEPFPTDVRVTIQTIAGGTNISFNAQSEVFIPAGQTAVSFGVSPNENRNGFITLRASIADNPISRLNANLFVQPLTLTSVNINSSRLVAGQVASGTVQIASPAEFDVSIAFTSTSADVSAPPVVMPAGQTSVNFEVRVAAPVTTSQVQMSAGFGDTAIFGTQTVSSSIVPLQASVSYQMNLPATITTPGNYVGEIVLLDAPLPVNTSLSLISVRPDVVVSPSIVNLSAGATRTSFTITVADGAVFNETVTLNAIDNTTGATVSGTFLLNTLRVRLVRISDSSLNLGESTTVAVSLNGAVSSGVADVTISLNQSNVTANLPVQDAEAGLYTLQIPQGASGGDFTIQVAPTADDNSTLTVSAILPSDISASATTNIFANLQVTQLNFGTTALQPGTVAIGQLSLNAPAPTDTVVRLVPADGVAFSVGFPNTVTVPAGSQTASVQVTIAGTISSSQVGIIAFLEGQAPTSGVTGFFTVAINLPEIDRLVLVDPILGADIQQTTLTIHFTRSLPQNAEVLIELLGDEALLPMVDAQRRAVGSVLDGQFSASTTIRLRPENFPLNVTSDESMFTLRVSLTIIGSTVNLATSQEVTLTVRPFIVPETIRMTGSNSVLLSPEVINAQELIIHFRGGRVSSGGTLLLSSSQPGLVTLPPSIDILPNTNEVRVPLIFVSDASPTPTTSVRFSVRSANQQASTQTSLITLARAGISDFQIVRNSSGQLLANVTANGSLNVVCEQPCYLAGQLNRNLSVVNELVVLPLGNEFSYVAFRTSETLSSTITATVGSDSRRVSHVIAPAAIAGAGMAHTSGQSSLAGNVTLPRAISGSTVNLTLTSSHPNIVPPVFYTTSGGTCSVSGAGSSSRSFSASVLSTSWCMDVRSNAISQPTPVTITLSLTSFNGVMTHTSTQSFTITIEPAPPAPVPTSIVLVATPVRVIPVGQNVNIVVVTNTPAPTPTPTPSPTPRPPVVLQPQLSVGITSPIITSIQLQSPLTVTLSVNTSGRRGTISISNTSTVDVVVNLGSSNSRVIGVPSSVTIPRGSRTASFNYTVNTTSLFLPSTTIRITASISSSSASANITIRR